MPRLAQLRVVELVGRLCHRAGRLWPDVERGERVVAALRLAFPDAARPVDAAAPDVAAGLL